MSSRVAVCAAAALVLAGCGKATHDRAQSAPRLPPAVSVSPTATIPPNAAACRAQDVALMPTGQYPGDSGDRGTLINVVARTSAACTLDGTPFTTVKDSDGRTIAVPPDKAGQGPGASEVVVRPGHPAVLRLYVPRDCASGLNEGPPWYEQLTVRIANEPATASGLRVPAKCREVSVSPFYDG